MSADNGIYILKTPTPGGEFEYRVREMGAVENLSWDGADYSHDPRVLIANARKMWKNAPLFTDHGAALVHADELSKTTPILEYGISTITVDVPFDPDTDLEPVGYVLISKKQLKILEYSTQDFKRMSLPGTDESADQLFKIMKDCQADRHSFDERRELMEEPNG
jgi:hypothetical protein